MKHTKKIICCILSLLLAMLPATEAYASIATVYYGSGNYVSTAPITPTDGLGFYVDYTAITKYGSNPFSVAFDWNGDYTPRVAAVAQYPLSATAYPTYFPIYVDAALDIGVTGETFFYDSQGRCINDYEELPQDENNIFRCSIGLTTDDDLFINQYVSKTVYLKKVIAHEIGHVFLLKHPTMITNSIMNQGVPRKNPYITESITSTDKANIEEKWGN